MTNKEQISNRISVGNLVFGKKLNLLALRPVLFLLGVALAFPSCSFWQRLQAPSVTDFNNDECWTGNSPFVVSQIVKSPNSDSAITFSYKEGLKESFTLNLKACMREHMRPDSPIQHGASFVVEYYKSAEDKKAGKKTRVETITDHDGCIQWQETYKYKYTVKPTWIGLERSIKKERSPFAGVEIIPMAVNPWLSEKDKSEGVHSILDTRCGFSRSHIQKDYYVSEGLNYLRATKTEEKPLLWVPTVSIQTREVNPNDYPRIHTASEKELSEEEIREKLQKFQTPCVTANQESCYRRRLKMALFIPLYARSLDMSSSLTHEQLNGGTYDVEAQIIISPDTGNESYRLHEQICRHDKTTLNQTDRAFSFSCDLNISLFNPNPVYQLALRIKPSSENLPFRTFEGIYSFNFNFKNKREDFDIDSLYDSNYTEALKTGKKLNIIEDMKIESIYKSDNSMQEEVVVSDSTSEDTSQQKAELSYRREGPIEGVNLYPLHLDGYGDYKLSHIQSGLKCEDRENVVERTAVFVGKVCMKEVLESQKINNAPFRVFLEKPKENSIEEIYYEKDSKKHFRTDGNNCIYIPIKIKHKLYDRQRYFQVDIHVLSENLNLYGKVRLALNPWQRAFQAFQDAQNLNEDIIRFDTKRVEKPELIINQFRSINLFPSYGLDKLLNIHLFHRVYFLFQPFVRRPDNLSLGLDFRARELLRDGHYLVRVLILRNPQETGNVGDSGDISRWDRVQKEEYLTRQREQTVSDNRIKLQGARYITHTDSVITADANFINFYLPLYLSIKQFYYIASRNIIVVEVYPADPAGFEFKDDGSCEIDNKTTEWKAYIDHELRIFPYAGAINIQNWVNWNLLQPVKDINTDEIISQSATGMRYKYFDFNFNKEPEPTASVSDLSQPERNNHTTLFSSCTNGLPNAARAASDPEGRRTFVEINSPETVRLEGLLAAYSREKLTPIPLSDFFSTDPPNPKGEEFEGANPSENERDRCVSTAHPTALSPGLEEYRREEESAYEKFDPLKRFARESSLKAITLGTEEGDRFVGDIRQAFKKYMAWHEKGDFLDLDEIESHFLNHLPAWEKERLNHRIIKSCKVRGGLLKHFSNFVYSEQWRVDCVDNTLNVYLRNIKLLEENGDLLTSLIQFILEKNLLASLELEELRATAGEHCFPQEKSQNCFSAIRPYIAKAMDYVIDTELLYDRGTEPEPLRSWDWITLGSHFRAIVQNKEPLPERHLLGEMVWSLFSNQKKEEFVKNYMNYCNSVSYRGRSEVSWGNDLCYFRQLKTFYAVTDHERWKSIYRPGLAYNHMGKMLQVQDLSNTLGRLFEKGSTEADKIMTPPDQDNIAQIIHNRINRSVINHRKIMSFAKSLCVFWFDSYLKNYLEKEQMISAYTNYVRKFDYHYVLEGLFDTKETEFDIAQFLVDFINRLGVQNEKGELTKCYSAYADCLLVDHCQKRESNKSKQSYCPLVEQIPDQSCPALLSEECKKDSSFSLCAEPCLSSPEGCQGGHLCSQTVRDFCLVNVDQALCKKYNNRCIDSYMGCLQSDKSSAVFNTARALSYEREGVFSEEQGLTKEIYENFPPLQTCLSKPYEFFHFENKMIVHELSSENPKYTGGLLQTFNTAANFSVGSYMNWTAQRQRGFSASAKTGVKLSPLGRLDTGFLSKLMGILSFAISADFGMSQGINSNESNSGRRAGDTRVGEQVLLSVGKANVSMQVVKFQKCLLVKPRPNAFMAKLSNGFVEPYEDVDVWHEEVKNNDFKKVFISRPGLIICNPVEESIEEIEESYYYFAQVLDPSNSQFLNLYDLVNRPFMMILRGRREFVKFYHFLRIKMEGDNGYVSQDAQLNTAPPNMFINYPYPITEALGLSLSMREFNETGFHPGIYTYTDDEDEEMDLWFAIQGNQPMMDFLEKNNLFDGAPLPPNSEIPVQYR